MNNRGAMYAQAARGPVLLITIGILFALHQADVLSFSRSWPLLIIAVGVMKLIERVLAGPVPTFPVGTVPSGGYRAPYPAAPPAQPPAPPPPPGGSYR